MNPEFENKQNIAGEAGISGNNQDPENWGPPALNFSSGIAALSDAQSLFNRNRTDRFSASVGLYRARHNITVGGDLRKQQYNDNFQQDPRGSFTFNGAATGSDLADFLIGIPDASSVAFGNADKYLRQTAYDAYVADDWRVLPTLTINAGVRWEYGAPMTELYGRLVNLDVAPGFAAVAQVLGSDPVGPLTGEHYPASLVRPDKLGIEPRIGVSWRPIPASTIVVRGGYGIYHDTTVYLTPVLQLAQQAPLSTSVRQQNGAFCPLTLADAFTPCDPNAIYNLGLDPNFRVGYAQTWQAVGSARSARRAATDGDVYGREGDTWSAGVLAQQLSGWCGRSLSLVPVGLCLRIYRREFNTPVGSVAAAAQAQSRFHRIAAVHLFQIDR